MSADVARCFDTLGGYRDSKDFNINEVFFVAGLLPVVNMFSGTFRLVSNIALAVLNSVKTVVYTTSGLGQWIFSKEATDFDYAADSLHGLKINVMACAYAVFESIPIIGNLPAWCCVGVVVLFFKIGAEAIKKIFEPPNNNKVKTA